MINFKLGVIGSGFMSKAIINGVINSKFINSKDIIVSDISDEALSPLKEKGVHTVKNNIEVLNNSDYTLLAIKPQTFYSMGKEFFNIKNKKIISIMAGVKKEKIKDCFFNSKVVRCMPNTPCSLGLGAVGIDASDFSEDKDKLFIKNMFSSFAEVVFLPEEKLNIVTAISGSSPAYFYYFANCLISAGVKNGLSEEEAKKLVVNTMIGSGKMILNSEKNLEQLIQAVCSKGGTTIEAVKIFDESEFSNIVEKAVIACKNRSKELEDNK